LDQYLTVFSKGGHLPRTSPQKNEKIIKSNMNTDIIDEIERYLSKFRTTQDTLKLKYLDEPVDVSNNPASANTSSCFNKTWCKLGMPEKLNRLMRYLTKIQQKLNLDATQTDFLRKFFYENVNSSLSSDDCVSYDPVDSEIITIIGLKCEGNNFYIQQPDTKPKPEGIRVKQRVFANITQLLTANKEPEPEAIQITAPEAIKNQQKKSVVIKKKLNASSE
jgi:hypothetical protein